MKKLTTLLLSTILFSCVTTNQNKAVRQIHRKLKKVDQLIAVHPNLANYITTTVYDTIVIKSNEGLKEFVIVKDTSFVDSVLEQYKLIMIQKLELEDSLENGFEIKSATDKDYLIYNSKIKELQKKIDALKLSLIDKSVLNQYFEFSDSLLDANIEIINGKLQFKYNIKEKKVIVKHQSKKIEVKAKKGFVDNWLFWVVVALAFWFIMISITKGNK